MANFLDGEPDWFEEHAHANAWMTYRAVLRGFNVLGPTIEIHPRWHEWREAQILPYLRMAAIAWTTARYPRPSLRMAAALAATGFALPAGYEMYDPIRHLATAVNAAGNAMNSYASSGPDPLTAYSTVERFASVGRTVASPASDNFHASQSRVDAEIVEALAPGAKLPLDGLGGLQSSLDPAFRKALLDREELWEVWIDWYERRLRGTDAGEAIETIYTSVPEDLWGRGAKAVNLWIAAQLALSDAVAPIGATAGAAHREMLRRLQALEAAIERMENKRSGMGGNHPPEPMEHEPPTQSDIGELTQPLAILKSTPEHPADGGQQAKQAGARLKEKLTKWGKWLGEIAKDLAKDTAKDGIKDIIKDGTHWLFDRVDVAYCVQALWSAVEHFVTMLG